MENPQNHKQTVIKKNRMSSAKCLPSSSEELGKHLADDILFFFNYCSEK